MTSLLLGVPDEASLARLTHSKNGQKPIVIHGVYNIVLRNAACLLLTFVLHGTQEHCYIVSHSHCVLISLVVRKELRWPVLWRCRLWNSEGYLPPVISSLLYPTNKYNFSKWKWPMMSSVVRSTNSKYGLWMWIRCRGKKGNKITQHHLFLQYGFWQFNERSIRHLIRPCIISSVNTVMPVADCSLSRKTNIYNVGQHRGVFGLIILEKRC